jgi:VanZ family protein
MSAVGSPNFSRPRAVVLLWAGLLLLVIAGELLPPNSRALMFLSNALVSDKFMHFSAYAVLALIPTIGLQFTTAIPFIVASELMGVGLEFAQLLVPNRSCDPYDAAANTAGVIAGTGLAIAIRSRIIREEQSVSK